MAGFLQAWREAADEPALRAEQAVILGGDPAAGADEEGWTRTFLDVRRRHLADAADPATRRVWAQSVDRVDALRALLDGGARALDAPFVLTVQGGTFQIP